MTWTSKGRGTHTISQLLSTLTPCPALSLQSARQHSLPSLPGLPLKLPPRHMCQSWILDQLQFLLLHSGSQAVEQNAIQDQSQGWVKTTDRGMATLVGSSCLSLGTTLVMAGLDIFSSSQSSIPKLLFLFPNIPLSLFLKMQNSSRREDSIFSQVGLILNLISSTYWLATLVK